MLRTKRIIVLLFLTGCVATALPVAATSAPRQEPTGLSLKLSAEATTLRVMEQTKVNIIITNGGREPVVLVRPGDGSDRELRTPLVKWLIEPMPGEGSLEGILRFVMDCGNINALHPSEVFTLAPGKSESFSTRIWATFSKPGRYRVRYEYENRPSMEWGGIVLGTHDEGAMRLVRGSTACKLTSEEVIFTVTE